MFQDERPIKPDKKYLQQLEQQNKLNQIKKREYLKKGDDGLLPCFKNIDKKEKHKDKLSRKTRAEVYENIKKKNREKFGQWNLIGNKACAQKEKPSQKLKPKNMTVGYKHKQIKIETQQYKKPNYQARPKQNPGEPQKAEYGKMLDYLKCCYSEFQKQKAEFNQQKQYLKFKKRVANELPLEIVLETDKNIEPKVTTRKTKIKNKLNNKKQIFAENSDISSKPIYQQATNQFSYKIGELGLCGVFTLQEICKYIKISELYYENNAQYAQALAILEKYRDQVVIENVGDKRISKFPQNWFEAWLPGKYRTAYNQVIDYKVTWFGNGDVRQTFQNKVVSYYCKNNKVIEINVKDKGQFLYFPQIQQLEMHSSKGKQVRYSDGHFEFIEN